MDLLVTLVAPMWVNGMTVPCHASLGCSQINRDQYWHNNQPLCIYCDPAYLSSFHLPAPFSRQSLTPTLVNYKKAMSQTGVPVEWLFNEIETYFKFVSDTNICLFSNSPQPKFLGNAKKVFLKNDCEIFLWSSQKLTFFWETIYTTSQRRRSVKMVFFKISKTSQENTCVGVSF